MFRTLLLLLFITSCTTSNLKMEEKIVQLDAETKTIKIDIDENLQAYRIVANVTGVSSKQTSIVIRNSEGIVYSYFIGPGDVDFIINSDWYDKECYIEVLGISKNSGELRIKYKIY